MDGHGLYVWLSYGISWVVILTLVWRLRSTRRQFLAHARARSQRHDAQAGAGVETDAQYTAQEESK